MSEKPSNSGMILDGVFSSPAVDTSFESVDLHGMDISSLEAGEGTANVEHLGADKGFGLETVGKIIKVRKIFSESDCEDDRQRYYWEKTRKIPYLYGQVRLYDAAGHKAAEALAAQVRDHVANKEPILVRWSIEGATLARDGNKIKESIARRVALTIKPANRTCASGMIADPQAPPGFPHSDDLGAPVAKNDHFDPRFTPLGGSMEVECDPRASNDPGPLARVLTAAVALRGLRKALEASMPSGAPSSRTQGAALQREDVALKTKSLRVLKGYNWRKPFKKDDFLGYAKAELPDVSDEFLQLFSNVAESYALRRSLQESVMAKAELGIDLTKYESEVIDLKKATRNILDPADAMRPKVYSLDVVGQGGSRHPAGRYMVTPDGNVKHLEDYYGILEDHLPEGPLDPHALARLHNLSPESGLHVTPSLTQGESDAAKEAEGTAGNGGKIQVDETPAPARPPVFTYRRPGWLRDHTLEFGAQGCALDGSNVTDDDLKLMLENVRSGLARVRYGVAYGVPLAKAGPEGVPDPEEALRHVAAAVQAGHLHPDVEKTLRAHIFEDRMVPGVGNKYAYNQFRTKNKPGIWVGMDGNNFKTINTNYGHDGGDQAIIGMGTALREAAAKVPGVKLWRVGGDETALWAPTHEHATSFLRHATQHLDQLPPIQGEHKMSMSFGLGTDPVQADKALYMAKDQKKDPTTGRDRFTPQKTPHLAHSLVPGAEGPIHVHHESPPEHHLPSEMPKPAGLVPHVKALR